jgi:hypothetical protein
MYFSYLIATPKQDLEVDLTTLMNLYATVSSMALTGML